MKIAVGVSGASGAIYAVRLLERLRRNASVEIHLIVTRAGEKTLYLETGKIVTDLKEMAHFTYSLEDISCRLASGSFPLQAMVVAPPEPDPPNAPLEPDAPCSIQTMSAIAAGVSSNVLLRAADVTLKERRKLVLMVRETPFHLGHLRTMVALTEMGAIIAPPIPGFYHHPQTVLDLVDHSVDRVLDLIGLPDENVRRWDGVAR